MLNHFRNTLGRSYCRLNHSRIGKKLQSWAALAPRLDDSGEPDHLLIMPKRKEPELTPAEQYKRFKEAAKKAGVTKDEKEFERAVTSVAPTTGKTGKKSAARSSS